MLSKNYFYTFIGILVLLACSQNKSSQPVKFNSIQIEAGKPLVPIQPTMYGIFFEDINSGADGGLYAELIKNRSFEFEYPWMGWQHLPVAETRFNTGNELTIMNNAKNSENNLKYVRIDKRDESNDFGMSNEGFDGIGFKKDASYDFSFWAKSNQGLIKLRAELRDTSGNLYGHTEIEVKGGGWSKHESTIKTSGTVANGRLHIYFIGKGQCDIDHISLFPQDTWKGRKGGLRKDLVQLLADLKPGFMRFPGGCIVEGRTLNERYQWKKTVGAVEERKPMINRWNMEFKHRPSPDYFQSFGLGFFEYFLLAEDIGAEPVPIISCGLACQFNSSEMAALEDLDPYVQDAMDLIEFANGDEHTKWGSVRAAMGHSTPFNLKYIGVGNEQWGNEYFERYVVFANTIKSKYPAMNIISGTGPFAEGELFEDAEKALTALKPEIVDEHYYKNPSWFKDNANRYDKYDRNRYKIFAGEYAAQSVATTSPDNKNTWECALAEAAFMTGLERNADVVYMSSYAPLFAHTTRWQWTPDLIWYDNLNSFGTANYYVQKLFSNYRGHYTLLIRSGKENLIGQNGIYGSASIDTVDRQVIIKLVNTSNEDQHIDLDITGLKPVKSASEIELTSSSLNTYNTIDKPELIKPVTKNMNWASLNNKVKINANTFKVFLLKV